MLPGRELGYRYAVQHHNLIKDTPDTTSHYSGMISAILYSMDIISSVKPFTADSKPEKSEGPLGEQLTRLHREKVGFQPAKEKSCQAIHNQTPRSAKGGFLNLPQDYMAWVAEMGEGKPAEFRTKPPAPTWTEELTDIVEGALPQHRPEGSNHSRTLNTGFKTRQLASANQLFLSNHRRLSTL